MSERKWISVDEELPPVGEEHRVAVFVVDYENNYTFQMITNRWESGWSNLLRGQKVTFWMHLPAPPATLGV